MHTVGLCVKNYDFIGFEVLSVLKFGFVLCAQVLGKKAGKKNLERENVLCCKSRYRHLGCLSHKLKGFMAKG